MLPSCPATRAVGRRVPAALPLDAQHPPVTVSTPSCTSPDAPRPMKEPRRYLPPMSDMSAATCCGWRGAAAAAAPASAAVWQHVSWALLAAGCALWRGKPSGAQPRPAQPRPQSAQQTLAEPLRSLVPSRPRETKIIHECLALDAAKCAAVAAVAAAGAVPHSLPAATSPVGTRGQLLLVKRSYTEWNMSVGRRRTEARRRSRGNRSKNKQREAPLSKGCSRRARGRAPGRRRTEGTRSQT